MKILTLIDYYIPGNKAGGPTRTISNMVQQIGDEVEFLIITRDRDLNDTNSYNSIMVNAWNQVGNAQVYYASPKMMRVERLRGIVRATQFEVLYLNSFFSTTTIKLLALRRLKQLPPCPVVLAPRGEFAAGALKFKGKVIKKSIFLFLAKVAGLYSNVLWQASTVKEASDIQRLWPRAVIRVAPNIPSPVPMQLSPRKKQQGEASFAFIGRISRMKNLIGALSLIQKCSGRLKLTIYGPVEDSAYWQSCKQLIDKMPDNITVNYYGLVSPDRILWRLQQHHFFLLPTLGENFGHAIFEALSIGCPVLISDRTSWRDLESKHVGWDIDLEDTERWHEVIQICIDMDQAKYNSISQSAHSYALAWKENAGVKEANLELFFTAAADVYLKSREAIWYTK